MNEQQKEIEPLFSKAIKHIQHKPHVLKFHRSFVSIKKRIQGIPFDPKFNAIIWAYDVYGLCAEIAYSLARMEAFASRYKQLHKDGANPSDSNSYVSFYADTCITRIHSCRDKIALMVWAFYCPFNPENKHEVLDYQKVLERLEVPFRYGLSLRAHKPFLTALEMLQGSDFKRVELYRHSKVHRREPRVEIYGPKAHHDWPYMIPLHSEIDIKNWRSRLKKLYPDDDETSLKLVEKSCYKKGILFDQIKLKNRVWAYNEIHSNISTCFDKLICAATMCLLTLRNRAPLRRTA